MPQHAATSIKMMSFSPHAAPLPRRAPITGATRPEERSPIGSHTAIWRLYMPPFDFMISQRHMNTNEKSRSSSSEMMACDLPTETFTSGAVFGHSSRLRIRAATLPEDSGHSHAEQLLSGKLAHACSWTGYLVGVRRACAERLDVCAAQPAQCIYNTHAAWSSLSRTPRPPSAPRRSRRLPRQFQRCSASRSGFGQLLMCAAFGTSCRCRYAGRGGGHVVSRTSTGQLSAGGSHPWRRYVPHGRTAAPASWQGGRRRRGRARSPRRRPPTGPRCGRMGASAADRCAGLASMASR